MLQQQDRKPLADMPQMPEDLMKAADAAIADLAQDEAEMDAEFLKATPFCFFSMGNVNLVCTCNACGTVVIWSGDQGQSV